jgi:DUF4097 and DUF4098 domain-containing protein YvlB
MNLRTLTTTTLLALSTAAFADTQFDRIFKVNAQPDLYVGTGSGNITIHTGTGAQIHVIGRVHVGWSAFGDIKDRVQRIVDNPPITQDGNAIHIGATNDRSLYENITIDYDITAPAGVALNLKSGSGDIQTEPGARYLSASSGSGNIRAHGVGGPADLSAGSGDIELDQSAPGDVKAKAGSGNIKLHGLNGALEARTGSGDIIADGHLNGAANLSSGSGNLKLHLGSDAHFNLEASTGSGDIHIDYPNAPHQDDHSRHHMTAPINGGGPTLEARTGSGNIEIGS